MKIYTEETRVKTYHVDKNGLVTTVQVFNFFQEAAFRHSVIDNFGQPDLAKLNMIWMLSKMKVVILEDALLGEVVEIKSWVRSIKGALSERDFLLICKGKVVVQATSLWACLSLNPLKPTPVPPQIVDRMLINNDGMVDLSYSKIAPIVGEFKSDNYTIRSSDVDMVNHTNNVVYVRMVLDNIQSEKRLLQMDINYVIQSFQNDLLSINTQIMNADTQFHEIVNAEGKVVCRLRTEWE